MEGLIRQQLEARERRILAPYAAFSGDSRGRAQAETEDSLRTCFQRDRDRIVHCKAFRRLKRKTQVFLAPQGDHYRTRLTHTLEVTQIARTVSRALGLNEDLTEAIGLGHDLGHTPFGHAGEAVLNEVYAPGFFHFEQSLRVVDILESRHSGPGLNLTWEVRDGILHHSRGKAVLQGAQAAGPNTLEGAVMSVCDAVAYINHDIDDAIRAEVITLRDLPQDALEALGKTSSERIDAMVHGIVEGSGAGKIGIRREVLEPMNALRDYLYAEVYPHPAIDREIQKAKGMLRELYHHLIASPSPEILQGRQEDSIERRTVDFVAGMTDEYALELYRRLRLPTSMRS
ncbi:MAG: deoxyguanosinetriphosphate triphosphohydrolase [Candidatus Hydrogenedentes bacterium]|nr:deoxyguanosinetriphosphate triphosphohydrolase [Candidatus Hydrogenedentota bacterium]